jgi:hypothetical protein
LKRASDASILFDRILEELHKAGLRNVQVYDGVISFEGGMWTSGTSKGHFGGIEMGEIEILTKDGKLAVAYRLRFNGLLFLTAACALVGFWLIDFKGIFNDFYFSSLWWAGVLLLVTIVSNNVRTASDFAALIRRAQRGD